VYDDLETFCLFAGYTRSGHSLVGTILDAHPEAVIAHEMQVLNLKPVDGDDLCSRDRVALIDRLIGNTQKHRAALRRGWRRTEPNAIVHGASNGEFTRLRVVGTKRGQETPLVWERNPGVFDEIRDVVGAPVKLIHVYRNPWDNIASMSRTHDQKAVGRYFRRVRIMQQLKEQQSAPVHDVALEDLIADPEREIRALCAFYGLDAPDDYVVQCAGLVDDEPHASRHERAWGPREIAAVVRAKAEVPWLERYPDTPE